MKIKTTSTDVLVVGGGTAALRAAIAASEAGASVTVLQKGTPNIWIVAFNAPVLEELDSPNQYFEDMVIRGKFLADYDLVSALTLNALEEVRFFEKHGVSFQHGEQGYNPRLTSGNQVPRSLYTTDRTGPEMLSCMRKLLRERKVQIRNNMSAINLLQKDDRVVGALAVDQKSWALEAYQAKAVVLATGGVGPLYAVSNNHPHLHGDGYILAYQANAELTGMEFVQFEPFWIIAPGAQETNGVSFLLHDGPRIYNAKGEEFLPNKGVGLGKDELSRAIFHQVQAGNGTPNGGVYFDLTHVPKEKLELHPRLLESCRKVGLDPMKEPLEVGPAQHYMMGGVRINAQGQSTVPGLFAAGEVTGGVHGADRMAGNSGTDVLVYGARAGRFAAEYSSATQDQVLSAEEIDKHTEIITRFAGDMEVDRTAAAEIHSALQYVMWEKVGLVRSKSGLVSAISEIKALRERAIVLKADSLNGQIELLELDHHLLLAEMIAKCASLREESRGAHFRADFPARDDEHWIKSIIIEWMEGGMQTALACPKWVRQEEGTNARA